MVKCSNCGWDNPIGLRCCEKCNAPLTYDVFISYSRKDYVDEASNVLENNILSKIKATLKANGISYWFDEEGIYSGEEFASILTNAIRNSRIFLFISSVNSNQSIWTSNEISTALKFGKTIIPFRIDNSPYNDSVMMKIASLDCIECNDEEKAMSKLIRAVKHHLLSQSRAYIVKTNVNSNIMHNPNTLIGNISTNLRYSDAFVLGLRIGNYGLACLSGKATCADFDDMKKQLSGWNLPMDKVEPLLSPEKGIDFLNFIIDVIGEHWGNVYENCAYLGTVFIFCFGTKLGGGAATWNERFVQICQNIGIPQHIYQRINHIDAKGMMDFRDVLRHILDNLDNSVTQCKYCGANLGFDYDTCPRCNLPINRN